MIERRIVQGLLKTAEAKADLAPADDEGSGDHGDREGYDGEHEEHDGQNPRGDPSGSDFDGDSAEDDADGDYLSDVCDEEHSQEPVGAQDAHQARVLQLYDSYCLAPVGSRPSSR